MSLFAAFNKWKELVHPNKVIIEGEIIGTFFSGKVEMSIINNIQKLEEYSILIGRNSSNNLCLHDFSVFVDKNPFILKIMATEEAEQILEESIQNNYTTIYGIGDDSYTSFTIYNILPNQTVTISADFEMPISYPTNHSIELSFPLTYPSNENDQILICDNFNFSCKFTSLPLKSNSIASNPEGKINLETSIYSINYLDPSISQISITYELNPPVNMNDLDTINVTNNSVLFENGIAVCCGKYGTFTFVPTKDEPPEESHSDEEFIFIVDCSKTMNGIELELASQCLLFFIKSIPEKCLFNIIRYGSSFSPFFEKAVPYTEENAQKALKAALSLETETNGGSSLYTPLKFVFSTLSSTNNKLRRIFILTDGRDNDPENVIKLIKQNTSTTMVNAIGIGYGVDRKFIERIGNTGNGFYDFILSGDDMRSKAIGQLSKSLSGLCRADISYEKNEDLEIIPPLSQCQLPPNFPVTFYLKASRKISKKSQIMINIEGKPLIIQMNVFPKESRAMKSLEYLFHNENLKYLRNLEQTKDVRRKIIELSIEYGILSPYTSITGIQEYSSESEKERITQLIEKMKEKSKKSEKSPCICIQTHDHKKIDIEYNPKDYVKDVKAKLQKKEGIPQDKQAFVFGDAELNDERTLEECGVRESCTIYLVIRNNENKTTVPSSDSQNSSIEKKDSQSSELNVSSSELPKDSYIVIKTITGHSFNIEFEPNNLVEDVKAKIQEISDIPPDQQNLIFTGIVLKDGNTLKDYGISSGSKIHLSIKLQDKKEDSNCDNIFIKTMNNEVCKIAYDPCEKIEDVKAKLQVQNGIPSSKQILTYEGKELEDTKTLKDYDIQADCQVQLNAKDYQIQIKTLTGRSYLLECKPEDHISDIKRLILEKEGIPADQQRLIHKGRQLKDENTLESYKINAYDKVFLILRLIGVRVTHIPARTFCKVKADDMMSLVAEQKIEGFWEGVPLYFANFQNEKMNEVIEKVQKWSKNKEFQNIENKNKVIGTIISLVYLIKFKMQFRKSWELIYAKGLKWLQSISKTINWEAIIKSL